jgi:hypothetical protein
MIPQPFVKGGGERVFFGPYEYPAGADLIFDFGNPTCTSAFNTSRIVYNVGSANVTASLIPYNNPGPIYPTLSSTNGGIVQFNSFAFGDNFMQWDWKSTEDQTNFFIYKPTALADATFPQTAPTANSMYSVINQFQILYNGIYNSSNTQFDSIFGGPGSGAPTLDTGSLNGRNGWNAITFAADESNLHYQYINTNTSSFDNTTITRVTSATQTTQFPRTAKAQIMAFLQYPKVLTPKEIRQINKVFAQRYFT